MSILYYIYKIPHIIFQHKLLGHKFISLFPFISRHLLKYQSCLLFDTPLVFLPRANFFQPLCTVINKTFIEFAQDFAQTSHPNVFSMPSKKHTHTKPTHKRPFGLRRPNSYVLSKQNWLVKKTHIWIMDPEKPNCLNMYMSYMQYFRLNPISLSCCCCWDGREMISSSYRVVSEMCKRTGVCVCLFVKWCVKWPPGVYLCPVQSWPIHLPSYFKYPLCVDLF